MGGVGGRWTDGAAGGVGAFESIANDITSMCFIQKKSYISFECKQFCTLKRYIEGHVLESMTCVYGGGAF